MFTKTKAEQQLGTIKLGFFISFLKFFIYYPPLAYKVCLTKSTLKFESNFEAQNVKKTFLFDCLCSNKYILNYADKNSWEEG